MYSCVDDVTDGSDMVATYNLQDPMFYDPKPECEGLAVRMFWPDAKSFPKVKSAGDVLILRGLKVSLNTRTPLQGLQLTLPDRILPWQIYLDQQQVDQTCSHPRQCNSGAALLLQDLAG